jgi:hypothetical protein
MKNNFCRTDCKREMISSRNKQIEFLAMLSSDYPKKTKIFFSCYIFIFYMGKILMTIFFIIRYSYLINNGHIKKNRTKVLKNHFWHGIGIIDSSSDLFKEYLSKLLLETGLRGIKASLFFLPLFQTTVCVHF